MNVPMQVSFQCGNKNLSFEKHKPEGGNESQQDQQELCARAEAVVAERNNVTAVKSAGDFR